MAFFTRIRALKASPSGGGWRGLGLSPWGRLVGVFLLCAFPALADDTTLLEWQGCDSLHVRFQLTAGRVDLKPDYRVVAMPGIVSAGSDTLAWPLDTVEFAGRRNKKYNDRVAVLEGLPRRTAVYAAHDTLVVDTLLRVEPWMRDTTIRLCISRVLDGCCNLDTLDDECLAQARYVLPVTVPVLPNNVAEQLVQEGEDLLEPITDYRPFNPDMPYPAGVAYVRFGQDKWDIDAGFSDNARALERVGKILERMQPDSASRIVRIVIAGTASPDGPLPRNIRLAGRRADALKDYICQRFDTTGVVVETVNAGEGWGNLRALLLNTPEDELAGRNEMLRMIDETADADRREHLLRTFRGGRPFSRLLDMFDVQRTASAVRLYYEAVPDTAARMINDALRFIQYGSYQAAVDLLEPLDDDRRYNALGTAYYMVGRRDEAMQCFERAAALGDENARENVRQLTESNEELKIENEQWTIDN